MKTQHEIKKIIADLERKRSISLKDRDSASDEFGRSVCQNLILIYQVQLEILREVLK